MNNLTGPRPFDTGVRGFKDPGISGDNRSRGSVQ